MISPTQTRRRSLHRRRSSAIIAALCGTASPPTKPKALKGLQRRYRWDSHSHMLMAVPGRHEDEDSPDVFLPVPVIPAEAHDMKNQIIKACHCSLAGVHGGAKATEFRVRARFYFPSISKLVRRFVARCDHCAGAKTVPTSTVGPKLPHLRGDDLKELRKEILDR